MGDTRWMRMGELSGLSGVPRHTIHYYIKKGLLPEPRRTGRTSAYYDSSHLKRLEEIEAIRQERNTPLDFVKAELESSQEAGEGKRRTRIERTRSSGGDERADAKHVERKREITEAAIEFFSNEGYYRTGIKDITDRVGMSTGTFYLYFTSKEELFSHAVTTALRDILTEVNYLIEKEKDFKKRLVLRIAAMDRHYTRFSRIITQLRAEAIIPGSWAEAGVTEVYNELALPVINDLRIAMDKGMIRRLDPELLACAIIGMSDWLMSRKNLDHAYSLDDVMTFMVDMLLGAIEAT